MNIYDALLMALGLITALLILSILFEPTVAAILGAAGVLLLTVTLTIFAPTNT